MIPFVTFLSLIVGGHVYNLWRGHVFTIPKRSPAELPGYCFSRCKIMNFFPKRQKQNQKKHEKLIKIGGFIMFFFSFRIKLPTSNQQKKQLDASVTWCRKLVPCWGGYTMDEIVGRNCRFLVDPVFWPHQILMDLLNRNDTFLQWWNHWWWHTKIDMFSVYWNSIFQYFSILCFIHL